MKVENMMSSSGNKVANQFIIEDYYDTVKRTVFQSYDSIIAVKTVNANNANARVIVSLDETYWDYSLTTSKYRCRFLGETKAETQKKIDSGEYILTDLN